MKNSLITGGAGFLGINLIRYLLEENWSVTSLDIADFNFRDVENLITILKGDIRDKDFVSQAMENIDIVIHTAAALPLMSKKDIFSTEVDGTRIVLEAAFQKKAERIIHTSSTAVYGIPDHHPIFENDKMYGVGPYGQAKILAEQAC